MGDETLRVNLINEQDDSLPPSGWSFTAEQTVQIGRHSDNDVVLKSDWVSRFHLTVFHDGKRWHCASFGANGTYCAGQPVAHVELEHETVLELGRYGPKLRFETQPALKTDNLRGTMTLLIDEMKQGNADSFEQLWARCFATIVKLARQRLGSARKRVEDEEDVASEVFQKLYFASVEGKLPELTDRQSLWRLLLTITRNTALDSINREQRAKRGGGHVRGHSVVGDADDANSGPAPNVFDQFIGSEPTPISVASVKELVDQWLNRLPDEESRQIALLRLEGFSADEISEQLGLSLRTTERRLQQIRAAWSD